MKTYNIYQLLTLLFLILIYSSCANEIPRTPKDLSKAVLIPKPISVTATGSSFLLSAKTSIYFEDSSEEVQKIAAYLANQLKPATGFGLEVQPIRKAPAAKGIILKLINEETLGVEGYSLNITEDLIEISANKPNGLFYGVQTIRQLLPAKIESSELQQGPWEIATGTIRDNTDYDFRGAMLDVSRHFFNPTDVKRFIDFLAAYKMNILHLHLADDQGWRIEIKSWPNLATHGGSTEVGGGEGGYFTQEQYKDIVQYAADRYITIIPEIDMPGHTNAALASYAELNCDGKARELYTGTEVGFSTLCVRKDITYQFVDDVIKEMAALTPGPYIHIGGDESHVTKEDDYIYFVNKVQEIVHKYGKQMVGWDEITNGSLKANSIAQHWADVKNAKSAVKQNVKIIMSPAKKAYLDMQYDSTTPLGLHWAAYIEVDSAYIWAPESYTEGVKKENILGVEAPLWTETVTNMDELEYMVFPRLPGYAEIGWTPTSARDWNEYKVRLGKQKSRFEVMGIDYYPSKFVPWSDSETLAEEVPIGKENN